MTTKKIISFAFLFSFLVLPSTSFAGTVTYEGYTFDETAFADYTQQSWYSQGAGDPDPNFSNENTNALTVLGQPDYVDPWTGNKFLSLGQGGSIIAQFTDNSLKMDGSSFIDLYVFEVGPRTEEIDVYISADGYLFYGVGSVGGATSGVDIDSYAGQHGYNALTEFKYVQLQDTGTNEYLWTFPGPDIDAIAANPINPVPIPGTIFFMGSGMIGLIASRRWSTSEQLQYGVKGNLQIILL